MKEIFQLKDYRFRWNSYEKIKSVIYKLMRMIQIRFFEKEYAFFLLYFLKSDEMGKILNKNMAGSTQSYIICVKAYSNCDSVRSKYLRIFKKV